MSERDREAERAQDERHLRLNEYGMGRVLCAKRSPQPNAMTKNNQIQRQRRER